MKTTGNGRRPQNSFNSLKKNIFKIRCGFGHAVFF